VDERIYVHPLVSWQTPPKAFWRLKDILAHLKRYFRQQRGALENGAIKSHLRTFQEDPEKLQATAHELIYHWRLKDRAAFLELCRKKPLAWWSFKNQVRTDQQDDSNFIPIKLLDSSTR